MPHTDERPTGHPCEGCGGVVVVGTEPISPGEDPEADALGASAVGSEWCTNLDCPSNHALTGLWRVGVNHYVCKACGASLHTPISAVISHRAAH